MAKAYGNLNFDLVLVNFLLVLVLLTQICIDFGLVDSVEFSLGYDLGLDLDL